jgi:alpha-tubulin suppressor-like RCC1 family protein
MNDGRVFCWGLNTFGELGVDPSTTPGGYSATPVLVASVTGATRLAAGSGHTCAIAPLPDAGPGGVYCWGSNGSGELGVSSAIAGLKSITPVLVPLPGPAVDVAGGDVYTCAVLASGDAYCWGADSYDGRLGGGGDGGKDGPTKVPAVVGATGYEAVTIGPYNGGVTNPAGHPYAWGSNLRGQLGIGTIGTDTPHPPTSANFPLGANASSYKATVVGFCAFVLTAATPASDGVYCWGGSYQGELGSVVAVGQNQPTPTLVTGFHKTDNAIAVASGYYNTCVLFSGGAVKCVGATNNGVVGDYNSPANSTTPQAVVGLTDATQVSVGPGFACAVHKVGSKGKPAVVCWGANGSGELGNGDTTSSASAVEVKLPD